MEAPRIIQIFPKDRSSVSSLFQDPYTLPRARLLAKLHFTRETAQSSAQVYPTSILKLRAAFLCCWRICLVCLALELVGPCVVLDFSVGMEAFDELLSINVPWSQEFPGVRVWT